MKYKVVESIKRVLVKGIHLDEGLKVLKENNYIGLVYDFPREEDYPENKPCNIENEIKKISECKQIEELMIDVSNLRKATICINELSKLPNLKKLWLWGDDDSNNKYEVDFSLFPNLEEVDFKWQKKDIINFDKLTKLKRAKIEKYSEKNMCPFSNLISLKQLVVKNCKIVNLEGIEKCISLEYLSIIMCGRLRSIKGIENLNKLGKLLLSNIKDISDISLLNKLPRLNELIIQRNKKQTDFSFLNSNSLEMLDIDYLDNLDFIKYQKQLRVISINKQVLSNDLSPLLLSNSLYLVECKRIQSYNFTKTEINKLIEQKKHYDKNELHKVTQREHYNDEELREYYKVAYKE